MVFVIAITMIIIIFIGIIIGVGGNSCNSWSFWMSLLNVGGQRPLLGIRGACFA